MGFHRYYERKKHLNWGRITKIKSTWASVAGMFSMFHWLLDTCDFTDVKMRGDGWNTIFVNAYVFSQGHYFWSIELFPVGKKKNKDAVFIIHLFFLSHSGTPYLIIWIVFSLVSTFRFRIPIYLIFIPVSLKRAFRKASRREGHQTRKQSGNILAVSFRRFCL